jgi:beta-glucosidase
MLKPHFPAYFRWGADTSVGDPLTHLDWNDSDDLLRWSARWPYERYGKPVVITENGMAGLDWVDWDGCVPDGPCIDYTRRMLRGLHRAITDGADVTGYFHSSFLDNFEWNQGYRYRFGLVHVDFATLKRTPKDSFTWCRKVIHTQGAHLMAPSS